MFQAAEWKERCGRGLLCWCPRSSLPDNLVWDSWLHRGPERDQKGGGTTAGSDQILHILHGDKEHGANPAQAPIPYWGAGPAFCCGTKQLVGGFF